MDMFPATFFNWKTPKHTHVHTHGRDAHTHMHPHHTHTHTHTHSLTSSSSENQHELLSSVIIVVPGTESASMSCTVSAA